MKTKLLLLITLFISASFIQATASSFYKDDEGKFRKQRLDLVESLNRKGISDLQVLDAMREVPRHIFVPESVRRHSYLDQPLRIGHQQTISQPFIVAYMCQALELTGTEKVLEIGTGSGYHAAVLSLISAEVYSIEIIPELGRSAAARLMGAGYINVDVKVGDGYKGWKEHAPFDAIILTAAPPEIPQPLLDQLNIGGRLVAPVGVGYQELVLIRRDESGYNRTTLLPVRFVPMTGEAQKVEKE